ncbi:hypothetical protein [Candidatus Harpocratesius sp.]
MIIFQYDILEQFLNKMPRNISTEVFVQYLEPNHSMSMPERDTHRIILQFLGHPDDNNPHLNVLHQCVIELKSKKEREEIIKKIESAFDTLKKFKIVRGKISEVVHSY